MESTSNSSVGGEKLNDYMISKVFSYLDSRDLIRFREVSVKMNDIATRELFFSRRKTIILENEDELVGLLSIEEINPDYIKSLSFAFVPSKDNMEKIYGKFQNVDEYKFFLEIENIESFLNADYIKKEYIKYLEVSATSTDVSEEIFAQYKAAIEHLTQSIKVFKYSVYGCDGIPSDRVLQEIGSLDVDFELRISSFSNDDRITDLPTNTKALHLECDRFPHVLEFPQGLIKLSLKYESDQGPPMLPDGITELSIDSSYNGDFDGEDYYLGGQDLPGNLIKLNLSYDDHGVSPFLCMQEFPRTLKILSLSGCDKYDRFGHLTDDLEELSLGDCNIGNDDLESLPRGIKKLILNEKRISCDKDLLPDNIDTSECKNLISLADLPSSLRHLDISGCNNIKTLNNLPKNITTLACGDTIKYCPQDIKERIKNGILRIVDDNGKANINQKNRLLTLTEGPNVHLKVVSQYNEDKCTKYTEDKYTQTVGEICHDAINANKRSADSDDVVSSAAKRAKSDEENGRPSASVDKSSTKELTPRKSRST